MLDYFSDF